MQAILAKAIRGELVPTEAPPLFQQPSTDRQIDQLVYELYGLTEEEIQIVEVETPS